MNALRCIGLPLSLAASMLVAPVVDAAFRCGPELITEGDPAIKLLDACGEPTTGDRSLYLGTTEWTYNFGPNEFMQRVTIREGEVERIEALEHGFVPSSEQRGSEQRETQE